MNIQTNDKQAAKPFGKRQDPKKLEHDTSFVITSRTHPNRSFESNFRTQLKSSRTNKKNIQSDYLGENNLGKIQERKLKPSKSNISTQFKKTFSHESSKYNFTIEKPNQNKFLQTETKCLKSSGAIAGNSKSIKENIGHKFFSQKTDTIRPGILKNYGAAGIKTTMNLHKKTKVNHDAHKVTLTNPPSVRDFPLAKKFSRKNISGKKIMDKLVHYVS